MLFKQNQSWEPLSSKNLLVEWIKIVWWYVNDFQKTSIKYHIRIKYCILNFYLYDTCLQSTLKCFPALKWDYSQITDSLRVGKNLTSPPLQEYCLSPHRQKASSLCLNTLSNGQGSLLHCYKILPNNHWKSAFLNFYARILVLHSGTT